PPARPGAWGVWIAIASLFALITGFALDSGGAPVSGREARSVHAGEHDRADGHAVVPKARRGRAAAAHRGTAGRKRERHAGGRPGASRRTWDHGARPHLAGPRPPEATWSRYVSTVDPRRMERIGCGLGSGVRSGRERRDSLVVLAFGRPMHHKGRFGASIFDGRFASSVKIGRALEAYARGFVACLRGTRAHLTLSA